MRRMKRVLAASLLVLVSLSLAADRPTYDADFTPQTMRVDLFHTGGPKGELVAVRDVVADGEWPGNRTKLLDETNLGTYLFQVVDAATQRPMYSRGYSSIYAEWETTDEARKTTRTFQESWRFPWPKRPVVIALFRRDKSNAWTEVFRTSVDPNGKDVNPARPAPAGRVHTVFENGPASEKVDLLFLGDGYTEKEIRKFHQDVERLVAVLFSYEPFKSRKRDFNVRALDLPTAESGVHRPQSRLFRRTALGTAYNTFGSERYVLTLEDKVLRDAAAAAPYDFIEILVNDAQYGGGGIFGDQSTAASANSYASYLVVHEFGHHFAGLADEYYTSDVAYETGAPDKPEPWEPNATALRDPATLKWRDLVDAATPVPTPWEKKAFEEENLAIQKRRRELVASGAAPAELDALFRKQQAAETKLLGNMRYSGKVGAFEGASYEARGLYRPAADCIMFSRNDVGFCAVCRRAIERVIDLHARP